MVSVFWSTEGILLVEFREERCHNQFRAIRGRIRRTRPNRKTNQVCLHEHNILRRREATVTVDGLFPIILPTVPI